MAGPGMFRGRQEEAGTEERGNRVKKLGNDFFNLRVEEAARNCSKGNNLAFAGDCGMIHSASMGFVSFSGFEEKPLFHNLGNGKFVEIGGAAGVAVPEDGRGVEAADLENSGAVDLILALSYKPPLRVFTNQIGARKNMLTVRLRGKGKNTFAIGARVLVEGETLKQAQEMECGGSFLSCGPAELYYGLADQKEAKKVTITWPSGAKTELANVPAGIVTVTEGQQGFKHEPYRKRASRTENPVVRPLRRGDEAKLRLTGLAGEVLEPAAFKDKWTVIDVWSAQCPSCVEDLKVWNKKVELASAKGASLVSLNIDDDPGKAAQLAGAEKPAIAVWRAEGAATLLLNPNEPIVPTTIVVGPDGKVAARRAGAVSPAELVALLDELKR